MTADEQEWSIQEAKCDTGLKTPVVFFLNFAVFLSGNSVLTWDGERSFFNLKKSETVSHLINNPLNCVDTGVKYCHTALAL